MSSRCSMRRTKSSTSSSLKALASDSIGPRAAPSRTSPDGAAPTRCVGESAVASSGCSRFQRLEFAHQPVVLGVGDRRIVEHVVAVVGVVDQATQFGGAGGGFGWHRVILGM